MNILFLSGWFPYPSDNGSKLRISSLLKGLASKHEISLLSFADKPEKAIDKKAAQVYCRDVQVVPWKEYHPENRRARLGFLDLRPRSIVDTFSSEMEQRINQTLATQTYNVVIASQLTTAGYAHMFRGLPALFEEAELGIFFEQFTNAKSIRRKIRHGLTWAKHRRYIANLLRYFRVCTVVSERERKLLRQCAPNFQSTQVIPNCIHLDEYSAPYPSVQPNTLVFTGSFRYFANHEAMVWFLKEVYPRIQAKSPNVRLTITGDHAELALPPADNVTLTGFVDNVHPLIASSWVSLAPIQQGGGTRMKILEAMALQTPVVATSKGAEGLDATPDVHLLIADSAEDFSQQVIRLLQDSQLRQRLADNAYRLVKEKYDWAAVMPRFLDLVESVARS